MPYTTSNIGWSNNHRPTADDLNRIEGNAEAGVKPSMAGAFTSGLSQASNTVGVYNVNTVAHTSYTGRIKITVIAVIQNSTGAVKVVALSPAVNGGLMGGFETSVFTLQNGEYVTVPIVYILTGVPTGVARNYGFRHRSTTDPGPTLITHYISVEDV